MQLQHPYLLFLGDAADDLAAKTAAGVAQWRPEWCVGQLRLPGCNTTLDLPDMTLEEAREAGARTLVVGVANRGGVISEAWQQTFLDAIALGYDVAAGLHQRLVDIPALRAAADREGRLLADVRHPRDRFGVGTGEPRTGRRLLAVGTDCSVGKMYTTLAIEAEMKRRGMKADFRATGQTGIFIAGSGISVDAVIADFISGAVETLCPANDDDHWDIIEGQGSLFHPSFAGVSLGLLHGAQAESLVLCHEPERLHMRGLPNQALPGLQECMDLNLACARLTVAEPRFVGIALNTKRLSAEQAERVLKETEDRFGLPTVDPVRTGVAPIVDRLA